MSEAAVLIGCDYARDCPGVWRAVLWVSPRAIVHVGIPLGDNLFAGDPGYASREEAHQAGLKVQRDANATPLWGAMIEYLEPRFFPVSP